MADLRMYKYPLFDVNGTVFDDTVTLKLPPSTGIQHVGMQNGVVTLWCLVDAEARSIERRFHIAGTGHVLPKAPCYLGTVFDRVFVWHIFELFEGS